MLKAWNASAFHAADFYPGAKEFARNTVRRQDMFDSDSKRIPKMVGRHVERIVLISFMPDEFSRVASAQWKEKFGTSVHAHAVQLALIANGWWRNDKCPSESFAYFMESGDTDEREVIKYVNRMRNDADTAKVVGIGSFACVDKGTERGIEAADFAAWHWNKYYMDRVRTGNKERPRMDFAAFVDAAENRIEYMFLTGADLKYFFSLVPQEYLESGTDGAKSSG
jgi:hypothetical protein